MDVPEIRFAEARGARLAYQTWGDGSEPVLGVPPLAQNIEHAWELPMLRSMFEQLGSFSRYAHFDKRGTGSSDRHVEVPGLDERVEDLRAVMDAVGFESAHLFGVSDGGSMAIMFAATYPERVRSLVLHGTGPSLTPADVTDEELEARRGLAAMVADLWGTPDSLVTSIFAPSMADDAEYQRWHQHYERMSADRAALRDLLDLGLDVDVRDVLPTLDVPTLVMHNTGDPLIDVSLGRELAASIPGATLIEHDINDHFNYLHPDAWIPDMERFITGRVTERPVQSAPTTARIITLGRFAVEIDGEEVAASDWGSRKARLLCMRLVAARGWPITREALFDMLWPDESDMRRLGARLSVQLSAVRRVLGGGVIADRRTVGLDLHQVSVDVEELLTADDPDAVVDAYAGEFLPAEHDQAWTAGVRDEARLRFVTAAPEAIARAITADDPDRAVSVARRVVDADPYDVAAHEQLITTLETVGLDGEARRAHAAYVAAMAELDIEVAPYPSA
ncbi:MAG: alpha/beta fold hydrolase [Acidimicrobiales bacterium]|nr:alpha/beta fold hydrolase [Acidimicrobiales bacterium]